MPYTTSHPSDPHPLTYLVVGPSVFYRFHKETGLEPACMSLLLLVDTYASQVDVNPTTPALDTGWLSTGLLRTYVCKLAAEGYITRIAPRRRAARQLLLTPKGYGLALRIKRELREQARKLFPLPQHRKFPARLFE
ncbi:hypothetical protein [Hymenobacter sediminicola]|uniref:Winged helix DNA-binding protein n=1 Tax=Hymenobacter sediminicola TaxID=2761579 RepID=A0A7G7W775_9BACT|nr:hypothetical protein [Hymenobacter sediminicola]QNH62218.1 hypothetical protein H4317_19115 [Hymenobacter sediminicola]